MSETRQFVNNLKNENGSPVYIEDKKLSERTTASGASSITSDFKFLLEHGSDGEFETALKAYVAEAIRAELGSILTNLDKGTSISSLAAISNGDLGSITPANLASVLGVEKMYPYAPYTSWYVESSPGAKLMKFCKWDSDYLFSMFDIIVRDTGSDNKLRIVMTISDRRISFDKIIGSPVNTKFYKDDHFVYIYFSGYEGGAITWLGGNYNPSQKEFVDTSYISSCTDITP